MTHLSGSFGPSNKLQVVPGVPQGSALGPLLFIMYINNIITTNSSGSEINMFADDIALYCIVTSQSDYACSTIGRY